MTTTPIPRWLMLAMLPVLSAVAYGVTMNSAEWIAKWAVTRNLDGLSMGIFALWFVAGPLLGACAIAYPLARFWASDWKLASVGVVLPLLAMEIHDLEAQRPIGYFIDALTPFFFVLFVPALAAGAHRALRGSQLVVAPSPAGESWSTLSEPLALKWLLFPMFALCFFVYYNWWPDVVAQMGAHVVPESLRNPWIAVARIAGPTLFALALAFPIARIHGRRALLVGAVAPWPSVWWWGTDYLSRPTDSSFLIATRVAEITLLLVLTPLAAARAARRFEGSRLAISHQEETAAQLASG